jgi:hypothetical protein
MTLSVFASESEYSLRLQPRLIARSRSRNDAQVDLDLVPGAPLDQHRPLRFPRRDHLSDAGQLRERFDHPLPVRRDTQQIQVANRLTPTAQRAGLLDPLDALDRGDGVAKPARHLPGLAQPRAAGAAPQELDPVADLCERLLAEALQVVESTRLDCLLEAVERVDLPFPPEQGHLLGPHPGDSQKLQHRLRHLPGQLLAQLQPPRVEQLLDLGGRARADPGQRVQLTPLGNLGDVGREVVDRSSDPAIGVDPKRVLSLDLQHVRDFLENAGDVSVGHGSSSGDTSWARSVIARRAALNNPPLASIAAFEY